MRNIPSIIQSAVENKILCYFLSLLEVEIIVIESTHFVAAVTIRITIGSK